MTTNTETHRGTDELEALIAELQTDPEVARKAVVRVAAEQFRRNLCVRLKEQRNGLGVSQSEIARLIGTSQPAVARLEAGLADPKLSTLTRYAAALGYELSLMWQPSEALAAVHSEPAMSHAI